MTYQAQIARALSDAENEGWPLAAPRRKAWARSKIADVGLEQAMARYGITRIVVDCFHFHDFRYTNLTDAIAQAQREVGAAAAGRRASPR